MPKNVVVLTRATAAWGAVFFMLLALAACGKKADPFLSMQVAPRRASAVQAMVRPDAVVLVWQAPRKNTDDSPLLDLAGFVLLRAEEPLKGGCAGCPPDFRSIFDYGYRGPRGKVPEKEWLVYYDRDFRPGTVYTYKLQAYNAPGVAGPDSRPVDVVAAMTPAAPAALEAEASERGIRLQWDAVSVLADGTSLSDKAGYHIYRSLQKGVYERFPLNRQTFIREESFLDVPEHTARRYYYTVRAVRNVRGTLIESEPSPEIAVAFEDRTPPDVPEGLLALPSDTGVLLKWMPVAAGDLAGYALYRRQPGQEHYEKVPAGLIEKTSFLDTTAQVGKRYIYVVTAVDSSSAANRSAFSQPAEVYYILK